MFSLDSFVCAPRKGTSVKFVFSAVCLFLAACGSTSTSIGPADPALENTAKPAIDPAFLQRVAAEYASWHRVDEWNHWAPTLCRLQPSTARMSTSGDGDTHGGKLYYLYAKDRAAYMNSATAPQPIGQVIVKESWIPKEVAADEPVDSLGLTGDHHSLTRRDGKTWKPSEKMGLFVMLKTGASDPASDAGWLYATTSADGSVVHASGRIESCMQCHAEGTHDRMFGLKKAD
jgi:hypothetical protein